MQVFSVIFVPRWKYLHEEESILKKMYVSLSQNRCIRYAKNRALNS